MPLLLSKIRSLACDRMVTYVRILIALAIILLLSLLIGCTAASSTSIIETETPANPSPTTATLELIKTPEIVATATASATPIASALPSATPTQPPLSFPAQLIATLPQGAVPQPAAWTLQNGCGQTIWMVPYQLPDGSQSLGAVEEKEGTYHLQWTLQQEKHVTMGAPPGM